MFSAIARRSSHAFKSTIATPRNARCFTAFWDHVKMGPKDPILGVSEAFAADPFEGKISVGVGAYRDNEGKPWVLPSVREAERRVVESNANHEYAPINGVADFVKAATNLAYGADSDAIQNNRVAAVQSLSGTGALRLASNFLAMNNDGSLTKVLLPNPTWGNHFPIFNQSGLETPTYRYWDAETLGLDFNGLMEDIGSHDNEVVVFHSCAHNPTGVDPSLEQWKEISQLCKEKRHLCLFDNAYQGFASGDTDRDVAAVRLFIEDGHNIALCQSFAKNFGLYGQRIGNFSILCENEEEKNRVESQVKIAARAMYSNPPLHGARIVATILNDPDLKAQWQSEIKLMADRINDMRSALKNNIIAAGSTKNWDHITDQIGMFSYTGLSPEQCQRMTDEFHVYLTMNGRVSMAGVTEGNVERLAQAIHEVSK